jgi:hypothetical protein
MFRYVYLSCIQLFILKSVLEILNLHTFYLSKTWSLAVNLVQLSQNISNICIILHCILSYNFIKNFQFVRKASTTAIQSRTRKLARPDCFLHRLLNIKSHFWKEASTRSLGDTDVTFLHEIKHCKIRSLHRSS